jgi:general secretion pathway protein C
MAARWLAFVIWAAVAATAVGWALRLLVASTTVPLHAVTVDTAGAVRGELTRLFGVDAAPVVEAEAAAPADSRFRLIGVAAPRTGAADGLALIVVDGKPARAFRVGAVIEGDTVLQAVRPRGASLGPRGAPATVSLELPPLPPPATGTMPGGTVEAIPADRAPMAVPLAAPPAQPLPQAQPVLPEATSPPLPQS